VEKAAAPWATEDDWAQSEEGTWWEESSAEEKESAEAPQTTQTAAGSKFKVSHWKMSKENQSFFGRVLTLTDEDLEGQTTGWRQRHAKNCATVATSKAAADAYGTKVFKSIEPSAHGLKIQLHDGETATLTTAELEEAREAAGFEGSNEAAMAYGVVMYATVAKQAQKAKHEGAKNYTEAMARLNDGEWPKDIAAFMGLASRFKAVDLANFDGSDAIVAHSNRHAIYIDQTDKGYVADHYGSGRSYNGTDTLGATKRQRRQGVQTIVEASAFTSKNEKK
jgi:hypothetical protein